MIAWANNEATVKCFKRQGSQVQLLPENPDFAPILCGDPFTIEGLGVGIIRNGKIG